MSVDIDALFIGGPAHGERHVLPPGTQRYRVREWLGLGSWKEHEYHLVRLTKNPQIMLHEDLTLGTTSIHPTQQQDPPPAAA